VLATLRFFAVLTGLGIGALTATVLSLLLWGVFTLFGMDDAALTGLTLAVLVGFIAGGFAAGWQAHIAHRFHGSVAGLVLTGLVLVIARLGGSPAPTGQVLWLALLGVILGGMGGAVAGRSRGPATRSNR
jgi:putative membrane protein (TIGR04086 family)